MQVARIATRPLPGQAPGTSGLRRKTRVFRQPHYLENYIQSIFNAMGGLTGKSLILGGDGREFGAEACQTILRMAAANGAARVTVGRDGLLSTPAASCLIRRRRADAGLILSASHNPAGSEGDFGVKHNVANGGPAPETVVRRVVEQTGRIREFRTLSSGEVDLGRIGVRQLAGTRVEIVDPVADYAALLESRIDFDRIRSLFAAGFRFRFDAMHTVAGPYAEEILQNRLGAPPGTVLRGRPLADFGGLNPDPNPTHAAGLFATMAAADAPDLAAATDGDGDRHLILGRNCYVGPSDSLAILAANARLTPGLADGLAGIARSLPTSRAADRVARALGLELHETPTGWKHFGTLLDAGRVSLCGEESFGAGSDHIREKDGLWAILMWLNILAVRRQGAAAILCDHWRRFGRDYFTRHDYEGLDPEAADLLLADLRERLPGMPERECGGLVIRDAAEFAYVDPVDGSVAASGGIRIRFRSGERVVFRLSGTGTDGATLRVYLERPEPDPRRQDGDPQTVLAPLARVAGQLCRLQARTGRRQPDIRT